MLSQREAKARTNERVRKEKRVLKTEPVELTRLDRMLSRETTVTQNVSPHGARVATQRIWEPGSFLLIKSVRSGFNARARVVYWRSFSSSRFMIGLEFLTHEGNWAAST